jgi:hypothetical protein
MSGRDPIEVILATEAEEAAADSRCEPRPDASEPAPIHGLVIGELVAISRQGECPLVMYPGNAAALPARTVVDLHGAHIGKPVTLMFENGDPHRPIVTGILRNDESWPQQNTPGQIEVDADGARMIVKARDQLVLRCGEASITLTKAGKVIIEGSYVVSQSKGLNRIRGGSVQIN